MPSSLTAGFDVSVSMTFPGEVLEHNGTLDGTTVTWKPKAGENVVMKAKGKATAESAGVLGLSSSSTSTPLLAGLGLLALLLVAGLVVMLVRRGRTPAVAGVATAGAGASDAGAVPGFAPAAPVAPVADPAWAPPVMPVMPVLPEAAPPVAAPAPPVHDTLVVPEDAATAVVADPAVDDVPEPSVAPVGDQPGSPAPPA
jgi:hypothetical protein